MVAKVTYVVAAIVVWTLASFAQAQTADPRVTEAASVRDAFWLAIDAQSHAEAYNLLTLGMQAMSPLEQFAEHNTRTRTTMGGSMERRVMRTTVYDNPPNAPEPGVYVAFDFVARNERADRSCGYIILHQALDGEGFRVTRTDQTYLENTTAAASNQPPDELWAQMATSLCPGWQRSWAIQPPV